MITHSVWRYAAAIAIAVAFTSVAGVGATELHYPPAPQSDTVDTYFGTRVLDPYRPLESLDSKRTRTWISGEESLTEKYLAAIPERRRIFKALLRDNNYEKISTPFHESDQYFYSYNSGLQNQDVYFTMRGPHGKPHVLIDPNKLSADGSTVVAGLAPSRDGKYVAYGLVKAGFAWEEWHVRVVDSARDFPDTLKWSKFEGGIWKPDDSGFYYSRYPEPKGGVMGAAAVGDEEFYFHKLGTQQSQDRLVYANKKHPEYIYGLRATEDKRYLVLTRAVGTDVKNAIYFADANSDAPQFKPVLTKVDANYSFIDNDGPIFYFTTTLKAPNGRVVAVDTRQPGIIRTVIHETSDDLTGVTSAYHHLFLGYMHDVHSVIKEYTYTGQLVRDVALPGLGSAGGFNGHRDDRIVYYGYASYTAPPVNYAYDIATGKSTIYNRPKINFDSSQYVTEEAFYKSKDGTRIPIFINYRKGLKLDGQNPTILHGYGGFDIAEAPYFQSDAALWMKMGGIYAEANIRGGSEYGEAWHKAGMVLTKQNVFDDFIAAAEYLIQKRYTSSSKIVAKGESNGGLLAAAVEIERPDLWGAALPGVGVLDMLRYHLWTDGKWWIPDYGCSTCNEDQFKVLYSYSPYHNIKPNTVYPPTMVMASDHDDHVFTAHSLKFAARLQAAQAGSAPILLRLNTNSGHGASNLTKSIQETADAYTFLVKNLHMRLPADFR
jgi:prolyl oligopeptidase